MQQLAHHLAKPSVGGEFVLAITNRPSAGGIELCKAQGVPCAVIDHEDYQTRAGFEAEMQKALDKAQVDLICAAGFMRLLTADFVTRWLDR
ncbi:MAG: formyltransferase family protein, partial [Pseudomonadota bacterium]|nr:formyltransferase family protein [Pseudomonadota bacterium]